MGSFRGLNEVLGFGKIIDIDKYAERCQKSIFIFNPKSCIHLLLELNDKICVHQDFPVLNMNEIDPIDIFGNFFYIIRWSRMCMHVLNDKECGALNWV